MTKLTVRGLIAVPLVLGFGLLAAGCASGPGGLGGDEDTANLPPERAVINRIMAGLGAVDPNEERIAYKPRAPLVVPPSRTALPAPQDPKAVETAAGYWPTDPEETDRQRRIAAAANSSGAPSDRRLTPEELARYRLPAGSTAASIPGSHESADISRRLTPEEMDGQTAVNTAALEQAKAQGQIGSGGNKRSLTEPPAEYRKPSPNAPLAVAEKKSSGWGWWPF